MAWPKKKKVCNLFLLISWVLLITKSRKKSYFCFTNIFAAGTDNIVISERLLRRKIFVLVKFCGRSRIGIQGEKELYKTVKSLLLYTFKWMTVYVKSLWYLDATGCMKRIMYLIKSTLLTCHCCSAAHTASSLAGPKANSPKYLRLKFCTELQPAPAQYPMVTFNHSHCLAWKNWETPAGRLRASSCELCVQSWELWTHPSKSCLKCQSWRKIQKR